MKYFKFILVICVSLSFCSCITKSKNISTEIDVDDVINSYLRLCYLETHSIDNLEKALNELMVEQLAQDTYNSKISEELGANSTKLKNIGYVSRFNSNHYKIYLSFDLYVYEKCIGRVVTDLRIDKGGKIFNEKIYMLGDINSN